MLMDTSERKIGCRGSPHVREQSWEGTTGSLILVYLSLNVLENMLFYRTTGLVEGRGRKTSLFYSFKIHVSPAPRSTQRMKLGGTIGLTKSKYLWIFQSPQIVMSGTLYEEWNITQKKHWFEIKIHRHLETESLEISGRLFIWLSKLSC